MSDTTRSEHVDRFNHDQQARGYDANVADERNPIRAGYAAALDWVAARCNTPAPSHLLELGCGTGNLTSKFHAAMITAVDISKEMMTLAAEKISPRQQIHFVLADVLEFVGTLAPDSFDVVASTYALHHLTDPEKEVLLARLAKSLRPGGRLVVADLMFESAQQKDPTIEKLTRAGHEALVKGISEEFFWDVSATTQWLAGFGFTAQWAQLSTLTWCLQATRPLSAATKRS